MSNDALAGLEVRSTITTEGRLNLTLQEVSVPDPKPDEVVVRVQAAPVNPSDVGLLLGAADLSTMQMGGTTQRPTLSASVPLERMVAIKARLGRSLPVGIEGAGTVVRAGERACHLLGKTVALFGGAMYAHYRVHPARECTVLPEGAILAEGAAMLVNPLTALSMVEAVRRDGHRALIHTAAASNLGQMLVKICRNDGIDLINIVRRPEQGEMLREIGAQYVIDSSSPDFRVDLTAAVARTGATVAFDAIGGGGMASTILRAMEDAAIQVDPTYHRYGSPTFKQVYLYGTLDVGPTVIDRSIGMQWSVGGFLLMPFLAKIGWDAEVKLRERITRELKTVFASHFTATIGLTDLLRPEFITRFAKRATGEKFLVDPNR